MKINKGQSDGRVFDRVIEGFSVPELRCMAMAFEHGISCWRVMPIMPDAQNVWRDRQPFVFVFRGDRTVGFRGREKDGMVFEENGWKVKVHTKY